VVLPVFNEAEALPSVLEEWLTEFDRLGIVVEIVAYDDGSSDGSFEALQAVAETEQRLRVVRHPNRGHGPTILRGYEEATGTWVFQVDSDGELSPDGFEALWLRRQDFDLLVGIRQRRKSSPARVAVTLLSRAVVATLFGRRVRDVNSPYRLMRRACLERMLPLLPGEPFAPNVLLSGLADSMGLRVFEVAVEQQPRRGGRVSLTSRRLWSGALRTLIDAIRVRRVLRRSGG